MALSQVNLMIRIEGLDPVLTLQNAKDDDLTSQLMCADIQIASGDYQGAFDRLLKVIKAKSGAERDQAKSHLISLFNSGRSN